MKTLFLSPSLSRRLGGIFEIELGLAKGLTRLGVEIEACGLTDDDWKGTEHLWEPVRATVFSRQGPAAFGFSADLRTHVAANPAELLHLHALWMYPSLLASAWGRHGKPYVVTPNGMLEPWALQNSAWKKRAAGLLYENRMLRGAACLQANTEKEVADIRAYGLKNPVCVIPNGVEVPEEAGGELSVVGCPLSVIADEVQAPCASATDNRQQTTGHSSYPADNGPRTLLFLGRLHPKKGLVNALKAWKQSLHSKSNIQNSKSPSWHFVIAGWDQGGHEADLKRLCDDLGLAYANVPATLFTDNGQRTTDNSPSVIFTGPAFGETKDQLLRQASAFILPSFSEGLPMSVLEAWAYRLPVLMTEHCNLPEGFAADAALRIGTDVASIAEGMRELFSLPPTDNGQPTTSLASLGRNGRALVERQFTWDQVAVQMKQVYEWVLGGDAPDCVRRF